MKNRDTILTLGAVVLTLALAEVAVRFSGLSDFPIYQANSDIGYIPAPSQSGNFLRTNRWQFNSMSMGAAEFAPSTAIDTLLIGDSVVLGGNPYREEDRLGPQLQRAKQNPVWPISAGSWGLRNELKYLKLNPEVVRASDQFIFVSNNGDFKDASSWSCEKTHPLSRPIWATLYVARKYVWDWEKCGKIPSYLLVPQGDWRQELREFLASEPAKGKPIIFILYPDKDETEGKKSISQFESRSTDILNEVAAANANVVIFSAARDPRWRPNYYRDAIHPTVEGTRVLAEIIASPAPITRLAK